MSEYVEVVGDVFDPSAVIVHVDQVGGHSAEVSAGPLGVFSVLFDVLLDVAGDAVEHDHVGLSEGFAVVLRGEEDGRHGGEQGECYDMGQCLPEKTRESVLHVCFEIWG